MLTNKLKELQPHKINYFLQIKNWLWEITPTPKFSRSERNRLLVNQHLIPILLYLFITLIMTFPLALGFTDHVQGDGGDAWQNIWNYWWTKRALFGLHNPYSTPLLYAPYGANLYLHSLNLFNGLISLPAQVLFGPIAAYNFVVLFSFVAAAYFSYLLFSSLGGNRVIGFVGGTIYAFGSFQLTQLYLGQANLFASEWIPAYILCLVLAEQTRGRRRLLSIVLGAVCLLLAMLCDLQFIILIVFFTALYVPYRCIARRSFNPLIIAAMTGLLWLIAAAPLLLKTSQQINDFITSQSGSSFIRAYSADLLSFFIPSERQSFWGSWAAQVGGSAVDMTHNRAIFLGYLPLILGLFGLWFGLWKSFFWLVAALVFGLLALGPYLQIGGVLHDDVELPYESLKFIPGMDVIRVPARFGLLVILCLAVLVVYALAGFVRKLPKMVGLRSQVGIAALLVVLLLSEHITIPFPSEADHQPQFYRQLGLDKEDGTVLELLYSKNSSTELYYQTIHQHPIVGGYLSRQLDYSIPDLPPITPMPDLKGKDITLVNIDESELAAQTMRFANVNWLVFLTKVAPLKPADVPGLAERYAQGGPIYQDDEMTVYRPKTPVDPAKPVFFLDVKGGWYQPERTPVEKAGWTRWFERRGGMYAWSFSNKTQPASLEFDSWSFNTPRHLTLRVDGVDAAQWTIKDRQHISLPLNLTPGRHQIEWRSTVEPATSPFELGLGNDKRALSFAVTNVEIVAR